MIADLDDNDKFDIKQENMIEFKDNLEEAVNRYYHGSVVCATLIEHNDAGAVVTTGNLLTELHIISLEHVTDFA